MPVVSSDWLFLRTSEKSQIIAIYMLFFVVQSFTIFFVFNSCLIFLSFHNYFLFILFVVSLLYHFLL